MTGHRRFPESQADPLSAIPRRTPITLVGHSAGADSAVRDVNPSASANGTTASNSEPWVFRSRRTQSSNFTEAFENQASYGEPLPQNDQVPSTEEPKPQKDIPYKHIVYAVAILAAFFVFVYTPFIRVAWIASLEEHGQAAAFAAQKCAILDMEDSIFRDGSLHPKLVRFGCTMVEPGQRADRKSQSKQVRPGTKPGRSIPDVNANTPSELGLWSFP